MKERLFLWEWFYAAISQNAKVGDSVTNEQVLQWLAALDAPIESLKNLGGLQVALKRRGVISARTSKHAPSTFTVLSLHLNVTAPSAAELSSSKKARAESRSARAQRKQRMLALAVATHADLGAR